MAILCIDPGMKGGWAVVLNGTPPSVVALGSSPPRRGPGRSGHDLGELLRLLAEYRPTVAVMETPQHVRIGGTLNATATAGLRASADLWRATCEAHGIEVHEVAPRTWQAAWGLRPGHGSTKAQAEAVFRRVFPLSKLPPNGAIDAALMGIYWARASCQPRQ